MYLIKRKQKKLKFFMYHAKFRESLYFKMFFDYLIQLNQNTH